MVFAGALCCTYELPLLFGWIFWYGCIEAKEIVVKTVSIGQVSIYLFILGTLIRSLVVNLRPQSLSETNG